MYSKRLDYLINFATLVIASLSIILGGCATGETPEASTGKAEAPLARKVGVLLVNHGSHSKTWREALVALQGRVEADIIEGGHVARVLTAHMEYTEPSIATQLKKMDAEGITDVVLIPVFLTVSPHSFDDIPTIIGQKVDPNALAMLKQEGIERYTPKAKVKILPTLDFANVLESNLLRRVKSLSQEPAHEGLVLVAYGDATYEKEWADLLKSVGDKVTAQLGIAEHTHAWCGHLVHYDPKKTTVAVESVLERQKRALVVPVLVAHDEMFQIKIIGGGIDAVADAKRRVSYRPDAILPDKNIDAWVIEVARAEAKRLVEL